MLDWRLRTIQTIKPVTGTYLKTHCNWNTPVSSFYWISYYTFIETLWALCIVLGGYFITWISHYTNHILYTRIFFPLSFIPYPLSLCKFARLSWIRNLVQILNIHNPNWQIECWQVAFWRLDYTHYFAEIDKQI